MGVCVRAGRGQQDKQSTDDEDFTWGFPCAGLFVLALGQRQSLALVFVGMFLLKSFH